MRERKRLYALLNAVMYFAIYCLVQFLIEGIYLLYLKATVGTTFAQIRLELVKSIYATNVISAIISMWIYALIMKVRGGHIATVVTNKKITLATMFMVCVAGVGARLIVSSYFFFAEKIAPLRESIENSSLAVPEFTYVYQVVIALFSIVVISPFFEEVLFRGLIMKEFLNVMRPWAAITLQALFFGVAHLALFQSSFALFVGIFLGIVYYKTKSITAAAVLHGVFNLTAAISKVAQDTKSSLIILCFGVIMLSIAIFYIIHSENSKGDV